MPNLDVRKIPERVWMGKPAVELRAPTESSPALMARPRTTVAEPEEGDDFNARFQRIIAPFRGQRMPYSMQQALAVAAIQRAGEEKMARVELLRAQTEAARQHGGLWEEQAGAVRTKTKLMPDETRAKIADYMSRGKHREARNLVARAQAAYLDERRRLAPRETSARETTAEARQTDAQMRFDRALEDENWHGMQEAIKEDELEFKREQAGLRHQEATQRISQQAIDKALARALQEKRLTFQQAAFVATHANDFTDPEEQRSVVETWLPEALGGGPSRTERVRRPAARAVRKMVAAPSSGVGPAPTDSATSSLQEIPTTRLDKLRSQWPEMLKDPKIPEGWKTYMMRSGGASAGR